MTDDDDKPIVGWTAGATAQSRKVLLVHDERVVEELTTRQAWRLLRALTWAIDRATR